MNTFRNFPRTLVLVLSSVGILTLAACGRSEPDTTPGNTTQSGTTGMGSGNTGTGTGVGTMGTGTGGIGGTGGTGSAGTGGMGSGTAGMGSTTEDTGITSQVQVALMGDNMLQTQGIDVETNNGEVRLRGAVEDQAQKEQAINLARAVPGVRSVQDDLTIRR